jgi:N-acetylglucosaminyl-diphospho-decaprenol L-rhamnosyltransferase
VKPTDRSSTPPLGIVVVHFGDARPTLSALAAILADPSPVARRVVVVDNSANLELGPFAAKVERLVSPDNPGFGAGANRGARHLLAREPLAGLLVLNHDVEILPGFLAAVLQAFDNGAGAAAGPLFRDRELTRLWYAGGRFDPWTGTVRQSRSLADATHEREVGFLPGAALALSCEAFRAVEGFDEQFFLYHEDLDLCLRLARRGFSLRFVPAMRAVHHLGGATGSSVGSAFYLEQVTRTRLLPHARRWHRLWLALLHTGWVAFRTCRLAATGGAEGRQKARALWRGHRDALASLWHRRLRPWRAPESG